MREALARLEHEGFLARQPSGRMVVRALDIEHLKQLYVVRAHLEGLAARLATPLLRTVDLEDRGKHLDEMERCVKKEDADGAIAAGLAFHDVIVRECGNSALIEVLTGLRTRISRYRSVVASLGDYDRERVAERRRILKAFYQRNAQMAELETARHVDRSAKVLIEKLNAKWEKETARRHSGRRS